MTIKHRWFAALVVVASLLAGCGAAQPSLDRTRLNLELSIHANQGHLIARMHQLNGSVMSSNPLGVKAALQNPTTHYGTLLGPAASWTLVFGAMPQKPAVRVFVNGHRAEQKMVKAGYIVWDYFLSGDVKHPVVKIETNNS